MDGCELCKPADVIFENELAYARPDSNALCRGPMLLNQAHRHVEERHSPGGYNI
jgi:hypothetical protein